MGSLTVLDSLCCHLSYCLYFKCLVRNNTVCFSSHSHTFLVFAFARFPHSSSAQSSFCYLSKSISSLCRVFGFSGWVPESLSSPPVLLTACWLLLIPLQGSQSFRPTLPALRSCFCMACCILCPSCLIIKYSMRLCPVSGKLLLVNVPPSWWMSINLSQSHKRASWPGAIPGIVRDCCSRLCTSAACSCSWSFLCLS